MKSSSGCLSDADLERLLAGAVADAESTTLKRHLSECDACKSRHETRTRTGAGRRALGPAPEPSTLSFDGYEVIAEIDRGGQGVVYRAMQKSPRRLVAIKILRDAHFAGDEEKERFEREVQVLGALKHPNIVTIYESGTAGGHFFYVMDYVEGQSLQELMHAGPLPPSKALPLVLSICDAVHTAHLVGVIHRDLKPANIRVDSEGRPRILDFGLAKITEDWFSGDTPGGRTISGYFLGSVPWAAPEQAEGRPERIDARTDVYSIGVILFQMLTGQFPYDVTGPIHEVTRAITHQPPIRPRTLSKAIDRDVETIILKCLSKDPARRYQTPADLARDLRHYLAMEPIEARRDSFAYVASRQLRGQVKKHPVVSILAIVAAIAFLDGRYGSDFVTGWTPWASFFHTWLARGDATASNSPTHFRAVRLIGLTDKTDVEAIAARARIPGISRKRSKVRSWRRLHGALMERLAKSKCKVVTWDIRFQDSSEYDTDFVRGVRALKAAGIDVIVSSGPWPIPDTLPPGLSATIRAETRWGSIRAGLSNRAPWMLNLVTQRGLADPQTSLALETYAAYRQPQKRVDLRLDEKAEQVTLLYWTPDSSNAGVKSMVKSDDRIPMGFVRDAGEFAGLGLSGFGLEKEDRVGVSVARIPADSVWESITREYQDVFDATEDRLREWFAGKIVFIADLRSKIDRNPHPDGRSLPGAYAHIAVIESMLDQSPIRMTRLMGEYFPAAAGALAGAFMALLFRRRIILCGALSVVSALFVVLAIAGYQNEKILVDPMIPIISLVFSGAACAWICRVYRLRPA